MQGKRFFTAIFFFVVALNNAPTIAQEATEKSLYDRLGGAYAIASVVDDFIEILLNRLASAERCPTPFHK